jgi:hypothetical protein
MGQALKRPGWNLASCPSLGTCALYDPVNDPLKNLTLYVSAPTSRMIRESYPLGKLSGFLQSVYLRQAKRYEFLDLFT